MQSSVCPAYDNMRAECWGKKTRIVVKESNGWNSIAISCYDAHAVGTEEILHKLRSNVIKSFSGEVG